MYESSCILCNPEDGEKKKKDGAEELAGKHGVYVGEFSGGQRNTRLTEYLGRTIAM